MRLQRARTHAPPAVPRPVRRTAEPRSAMLTLTAREGPAAPRFRTIQVWPKDLPAALRQAECAVNRASGAVAMTPDDRGGSSHVRHETPRVHNASWRRRCVAARGSRAPAEGGDHRRAGYWQYNPRRILEGVSAGTTRTGGYRGAGNSVWVF